MFQRRLVLVVVTAAALSGCADPNAGLSRHLPDPVYIPRPPQRRVVRRPPPSAPIARPVPRPAPPRMDTTMAVMPPGGLQRSWRYIVIHHSATHSGSAERFDHFHRSVNHWDELGYHFVIGNGNGSSDGLVEVGSRWWKQKHGAHCKTPDNRFNDYGIGICLVGDFENGGHPTAAQIDALERLVLQLMRSCDIPLAQVYGHAEVTHRTACPGRNFPVAQFKNNLGSLALR